MPAAIPACRAASRIFATAASNLSRMAGSIGNAPPTARLRSDGPTYTPSRPGVAQIASTSDNAVGVSIIATTTLTSFAAAGFAPIRSAARLGA
jgi:hypothetical protein